MIEGGQKCGKTLRARYRYGRVIGLPAVFAFEIAKDSLTRNMSPHDFVRSIVELDARLRLHLLHGFPKESLFSIQQKQQRS
jgi:hypothetical protein